MTDEKIREAISKYRTFFSLMGAGKIDFPHDRLFPNKDQVLEHCHGMLDQMEKFLREGNREKVFRWLGFIQGCLWSSGWYRMDELKEHNRS